jgi:FMN phosphatase YigB (HAD superfamily)
MLMLAMDFDGVIADSISECAVAGYNGYEAYRGNNDRIKTPEEIPSDKLIKFRSMRPYIRSGEDYVYLFQALNDGFIIDTQDEFDEFQSAFFDRIASYRRLFNAARQMLITNNYDAWIALNPLYPGMSAFLQSIHNKVHIVSTKPSKYILEILKANGIILNLKQVHEAGKDKSKTSIINSLMQDYQLEPLNITFIDDHLDTLRKVKSTGVRCLLAGWGYNTIQQRYLCSTLNLEMIDLQHLYKEFEGL